MYRNLIYFNNLNNKSVVKLYTWDKAGNRIATLEEFNPYSYISFKDKIDISLIKSILRKEDFVDIYGNNILKLIFANNIERNNFHENYGSIIDIISSFTPTQEYIHHKFANQIYPLHSIEKIYSFSKHNLKIYFIDIEIGTDEGIPDIFVAKNPIVLISIYDIYNNKIISFANKSGINRDHSKLINELYLFDSEQELIEAFLEFIKKEHPDIISGWNIKSFDLPYLYYRCIRLFNDETYINRMIEGKSYGLSFYINHKNIANKIYFNIRIPTYSIIDYMELYRDKFMFTCASYSLDAVSKQELGLSKTENTVLHNVSFKDRWTKYYDDFLEYNVNDVILLKKLEDKLNLLKLSRIICNMCLVEYESIFSTTKLVSSLLYNYSLFHYNKIFKTYLDKDNIEDDITGYTGAFVLDTKPTYRNKTQVCIDFNSLYPMTMLTLNLSPETKVEKDNLAKYNINDLIKAKNDTYFVRHNIKLGVIPSLIDFMYSTRVSIKKKLVELQKSNKNSDKIIFYKLFQENLKNIMNSIYGLFGSKYSPIKDKDLAEAITITDRFIITTIIKLINEYFSRKTNGKIKESVLLSDTDSVIIDTSYFLENYLKSKNITENEFYDKNANYIKDFVEIIIYKFIDRINDFIEKSIIKQEFNSDYVDKIKFKFEYLSKVGFFLAKKHYLVNIIYDGINMVDIMKYTGIEIKRKEFSEKVKNILERIYLGIIKENWNNNPVILYNEIVKLWNGFKQFDFDDISFHKGYYSERVAKEFLEMEKAATIQSKAAIFYNQLLEKLNLTNKYEKIYLNDKIRFCYVKSKNKKYNVNVIGYKNKFPDEFRDLFEIDYKTMWNKTIFPTLEKIATILNIIPFDIEELANKTLLLPLLNKNNTTITFK